MAFGTPWVDGYGDGYAGRATRYINRTGDDYVDRKKAEAWRLTCPQYYYMSPFVRSVYDDLSDYEAGRLGDSLDLPAPYLEYLRILSYEKNAWNRYWEFEVMKKT